jgi:hypothetical protein
LINIPIELNIINDFIHFNKPEILHHSVILCRSL